MTNIALYLKSNRERLVPLFIFGFLVLATFLTIFISQRRQELRKKAAADTGQLTFAGLNPPIVNQGQTFSISVNLSSQEIDPVAGADILVAFDASKLTLTAITLPNLTTSPFKTYAPVDTNGNFDTTRVISCANSGGTNCGSGTGVVEFGIVSFDWSGNTLTSPSPQTVVSPVATLTFQVKTTATDGPTQLNFVNNGITSTTDSNIVVAPAGGNPEDILQPLPYANSSATVTIGTVASPSPTLLPTPSPSPSPSVAPTPSPSPTPTPTPSGSPIPSPTPTASVILQVRFEGIFTNQGGDRPVRVTLSKGAQVIMPETAVIMSPDAGGIYSNTVPLTNIVPDTYDVYVDGPTHLTRRFTGVVISSGNNVKDLTTPVLLSGDIADNDRVDIFDYNDLVTFFACRLPPASPPPGKTCSSFASDLDFDGDIDIFDYNFLVGNFNRTGD